VPGDASKPARDAYSIIFKLAGLTTGSPASMTERSDSCARDQLRRRIVARSDSRPQRRVLPQTKTGKTGSTAEGSLAQAEALTAGHLSFARWSIFRSIASKSMHL